MPASPLPPLTLNDVDIARLWLIFDQTDKARSNAVLACTIVMRESGGKADAYRPANKNKLGGEDRGIFQINSKAWPAITDAMAYEPVTATEMAFNIISKKGTDFSAWNSSGPTVPNPIHTAAVITAETFKERVTRDLDAKLKAKGYKTVSQRAVEEVSDDLSPSIPNALEPLARIAEFFAALGTRLFNVQFWKALGLGLLGIALTIGAVSIFVKGEENG